jgi:hypothetical protein
MENKKYPSWKFALTYGLYIGIALIILSLIFYLLDLQAEKWTSYITYVVLLLGILLAQMHYRDKHLDGYFTFGQSFSVGFLTGLFASIIAAIFSFFFISYLGEDFIETLLEKTMTELEANQNLSDEQIEQSMNWARKFMTPGIMTIFGLLSSTFVSLILALIAAAFTKKQDNSLESNI